MHSFRSKTHILGIFTPFRCSTTSVWFRTMYFTSKTHVSGGFTPFHCHTRPIMKIIIGFIKCTSLCLRNHFLFSHNEPNPLFQSKSHVLGGSMPFRSRTWHIAKTSIEAHLLHEFMPLEPFLFFCNKHVHSTTFGLKLMFWMVSRHFVAAPDPLLKLVSGCIKEWVCALENISCLVATNMLNP